MARKRKRSILPLWLVIVIVIVAVGVYFYLNRKDASPSVFSDLPEGGNGVLNIYFLDIGQGDCSIIHLPDGKFMIIDSGNNDAKSRNKIKQITDELNISRFDYLLLTHADSDHCGSMRYVVDNYEIKKAFRPNVLSTYSKSSSLGDFNVGATNNEGGNVKNSAAYYNFLYALKNEEGCESVIFNKDSDFRGEEYDYSFDFYTPVADVRDIKYTNANDYSPIFTLTYNHTTVLFTGDAEAAAEKEFLESYAGGYPDCDLIKIGHHGSATSSSDAFLNAVRPEYAVIQCGEGNSYGHPTQLALDRLKARSVGVYRNDTNGDIAISITADTNYKFSSEYIYCLNTDMTNNYQGGSKQ